MDFTRFMVMGAVKRQGAGTAPLREPINNPVGIWGPNLTRAYFDRMTKCLKFVEVELVLGCYMVKPCF